MSHLCQQFYAHCIVIVNDERNGIGGAHLDRKSKTKDPIKMRSFKKVEQVLPDIGFTQKY